VSAADRATGIALFDLDHTLLGGDSTYEWIHFLIRQGAIDRDEYAGKLEKFYDDYAAGTLDIQDFLRFDFSALSMHPRAQLEAWRKEYLEHSIAPIILPKARDLIASHKGRRHLTAIVTAANSFVTAPIAESLGVENLLASVPECVDGEFTGNIDGIPCFHEGKATRLDVWLGERGKTLGDFAESYFYGDSQSDIPLMERVTHPVAVGDDATLGRVARERGWPVISLR